MGDCPWLLTVILILGYTLSAALAWRSRLLLSERDGAYLILQSCAIISFSLLLWLSLVVNVLLIIPTPSLSHRLAQLLVQLSDLFLLLAFQAALLVEMRIRHAGYKINCWMDMAILLETLCSLLVLVLAASVIVEMVTEDPFISSDLLLGLLTLVLGVMFLLRIIQHRLEDHQPHWQDSLPKHKLDVLLFLLLATSQVPWMITQRVHYVNGCADLGRSTYFRAILVLAGLLGVLILEEKKGKKAPSPYSQDEAFNNIPPLRHLTDSAHSSQENLPEYTVTAPQLHHMMLKPPPYRTPSTTLTKPPIPNHDLLHPLSFTPSTHTLCSNCHNPAIKQGVHPIHICAGCFAAGRRIMYCSPSCKVMHAPQHKVECVLSAFGGMDGQDPEEVVRRKTTGGGSKRPSLHNEVHNPHLRVNVGKEQTSAKATDKAATRNLPVNAKAINRKGSVNLHISPKPTENGFRFPTPKANSKFEPTLEPGGDSDEDNDDLDVC